jgi:putative aldouronate transport system permease protein
MKLNNNTLKLKRINEGFGSKVFDVFNIIFMILFCIIMIYPYLNVVALAFNNGVDAMRGGLTFYPRVFTLENIVTVLREDRTLPAVLVSLRIVIIGTVIAVLVEYCCAYSLKKKKLIGRKAITTFLIIPMFISGGLIPTYLLFSYLHLINNFWVYVLPDSFGFFNMIIIRAYLYSIPESLEESAKIDGANEVYILFRIMMPLSKPIIATIALWHMVGLWNDWTTCLYFITKQSLYPLQFLLWQFIRESEIVADLLREAAIKGQETGNMKFHATPETVKAAQVVITTIPIILVYPFLQKYFIKGILIGSVKE